MRFGNNAAVFGNIWVHNHSARLVRADISNRSIMITKLSYMNGIWRNFIYDSMFFIDSSGPVPDRGINDIYRPI